MLVTTKDFDALLFAMVDAVLRDAATEAREHYYAMTGHASAELRSNARWYWFSLLQHLGWWRSTWPGNF